MLSYFKTKDKLNFIDTNYNDNLYLKLILPIMFRDKCREFSTDEIKNIIKDEMNKKRLSIDEVDINFFIKKLCK